MATFTYNVYLVDENNQFILDENGDRIVLSTETIAVSDNTRAIGAQCGHKIPPVQSFQVTSPTTGEWHLTVNRSKFIGRYQSREDALLHAV